MLSIYLILIICDIITFKGNDLLKDRHNTVLPYMRPVQPHFPLEV